jgi:aminoglycoside phosphotransferase (APT) family kinase protein
MEYVQGRILKDSSLPDMAPSERKLIYDEMNTVLAKIHSVDHKKAGLADYGKAEGYVQRFVDISAQ